jgi:type I restriction enzyme M protein
MASDIWSVADKLRGPYMRHEYGEVILPLTVLLRLDAVMAKTRQAVWDRDATLTGQGIQNKDTLLKVAAKLPFYNTSKQDFSTIGADAAFVAKNLRDYIAGFSENVRKIIERFDLDNQITRMAEAKILYDVIGKFASMHGLDALSTHDMGYVFEHLIRKFYEDANATAGEHFTPREVIELMVNLLIAPDQETIRGEGQVINILDPACGTGGMLTTTEDKIKSFNPAAKVYLWGQELNPQSWATCGSEMLLREQPGSIFYGNSFSNDGYRIKKFDYMLANPPFGVEWKTVKQDVEDEKGVLGYAGRFGAGLPRINDGSLLFLQHMISKMEPVEGKGCRLAIVFNGSPLFTGAAESGESNIRKWILENDWLEGIVALPDQLFYNTGISTYFWILSNRKDSALKGKVILLDARDQWEKMRRSLGDKRKQISDNQLGHITKVYGEALTIAADPEHSDHGRVKVFKTTDFGYRRITVERPLKQRFELTDDTLVALAESKAVAKWEAREIFIEALQGSVGSVWWTKKDAEPGLINAARSGGALWPSSAPVLKAIWSAVSVFDPDGEVQRVKGAPLPDPDLRDYENVPLSEDVEAYFAREVLPHVPDAWIDHDKTKIGYEIPFTRHFYVYTPPRPLAEIDADLRDLESQIQKLLSEVTE